MISTRRSITAHAARCAVGAYETLIGSQERGNVASGWIAPVDASTASNAVVPASEPGRAICINPSRDHPAIPTSP